MKVNKALRSMAPLCDVLAHIGLLKCPTAEEEAKMREMGEKLALIRSTLRTRASRLGLGGSPELSPEIKVNEELLSRVSSGRQKKNVERLVKMLHSGRFAQW